MLLDAVPRTIISVQHPRLSPADIYKSDMRWYTTAELCSILSRFDAIHIVGDSMMRHLAQSLNVYLREDIVTGARTTWLSGNPDGLDCSCRTVFDKHDCATEGYAAIGTADLWEHDPNSVKCGVRMREAKLSAGKSQGKGGIASVDFLASMKGPPEDREVSDFRKSIQSGKKEAFVFGQGGWDDFEMEPAKKWIEAFEGALADEMPSFIRPPVTTAEKKGDEEKTGDAIGKPVLARRADDWRSKFPVSKDHPPRLWVSPNAQGVHKNPFFVLGQNNIKLMGFETGMRSWLADRGFDSLGIFNLTVQSTSLDGTHATMESNLVKAMMVSASFLEFC